MPILGAGWTAVSEFEGGEPMKLEAEFWQTLKQDAWSNNYDRAPFRLAQDLHSRWWR